MTAPGSPQVCEKFRGSLVRQQVRFCKENPVFMDSVKRGAIWAIDECQFQFRTRRWNCSTLNDDAIEAFKKALKPKPPPGTGFNGVKSVWSVCESVVEIIK